MINHDSLWEKGEKFKPRGPVDSYPPLEQDILYNIYRICISTQEISDYSISSVFRQSGRRPIIRPLCAHK